MFEIDKKKRCVKRMLQVDNAAAHATLLICIDASTAKEKTMFVQTLF